MSVMRDGERFVRGLAAALPEVFSCCWKQQDVCPMLGFPPPPSIEEQH
jgi:hypothetical protein